MDRLTVVVGGTGALGFEVCRHLRAAGHPVLATHRRDYPEREAALAQMGCAVQRCDLSDPGALEALVPAGCRLVLTPILTTSGPAFRRLPRGHVGQAVLFSSGNVTVDQSCPKYAALRDEEAALKAASNGHTVVRPTMIYGHADDGNLARLMAIAKRYPVLPVPNFGQVRCQPIHIDDLATLVVNLLDRAPEAAPVLAAGPEPMTMAQLMARIRRASGHARMTVPIPLWMLRMAGWFVRIPLDAAQISRARQDRVPDTIPAISGWQPIIGIDEGLDRLANLLDAGAATPHMNLQ